MVNASHVSVASVGTKTNVNVGENNQPITFTGREQDTEMAD